MHDDARPSPRKTFAWVAREASPSAPYPTWELAAIVAQLEDGSVRVDLRSSNPMSFRGGHEDVVQDVVTKWHPHDISHDSDFDDAGQMSDLHEAPLLNLLSRRFARGAIYTWTGDILLSVNPYREVPSLYDDVPNRSPAWNTRAIGTPAHISAVADAAFARVAAGVPSQVQTVDPIAEVSSE